ncbi:hypothetical protein NHH03_26115 [Stieleria sp. TO1_6]|uniref:hypothetical protein n=1 Tax=Stieleria tagensis TaxID=2956795 RepID=UPI00209B5C93|nr:hypothetical protein [Stieleria tagensis]MCO8125240.1 hypothetical protein [Stieleria tagensis]
MDILRWIRQKLPGVIEELEDRLEITHESGEQSTLWKRTGNSGFDSLQVLGTIYTDFDGLDVFSSTFKFASAEMAKSKNGVDMTFSLALLKQEVSQLGCDFPSASIPFMYQAGIGYGAVDVQTGVIYECDVDSGERSDEYNSLEELMDEWLAAIS